MKTNYVLIDFENVQPKNIALLADGQFRIKVFVGSSQKKVPVELAEAMQQLGRDAEYIRIAGNGSNALDFHIAYTIGRLAAEDPGAAFQIVSRDRGFDPLIAYLKTRKIACSRVHAVEDIPLLKGMSAASTPDKADAVVAHLVGRGTSKPRTERSLRNSIVSLFGNKLDKADVDQLMAELKHRGVVKLDGNKVHYALPG